MNYNTVREWGRTVKPNGEPFELRIFGAMKLNGYFTGVESAITALQHLDASVLDNASVYFTLNQLKHQVLADAKNVNTFGAMRSGEATKDKDISRYNWLFIDVDPERETGVCATEEEKGHARTVITKCSAFLKEKGFAEPIVCDSGNGYHLLYKVDVEVEEGERIIEGVIKLLDRFFSSREAKVDKSVFNPSRISKLYGCMSRKGDNTQERPHRESQIIYAPNKVEITPLETIKKLLEEYSTEIVDKPAEREIKANSAYSNEVYYDEGIDLDEFLKKHNIKTAPPVHEEGDAHHEPGTKWVLDVCPFNKDHTGSCSYVKQFSSGGLVFKCSHDSHRNLSWRNFRMLFDPKAYILKKNEKEDAKKISNYETLVSMFKAGGFPMIEKTIKEMIADDESMKENKKSAKTKELSNNIAKLISEGKTDQALALMTEKAPELQALAKENEYKREFTPRTWEERRNSYTIRPEGFRTGIMFAKTSKKGKTVIEHEEEMVIPAGGLTLVCGLTSHGKSKFLQNLALKFANDGKEGSVLYFTYEEDRDSVEQQFLNIMLGKDLNQRTKEGTNISLIERYFRTGETQYINAERMDYFNNTVTKWDEMLDSGKLIVSDASRESTEFINSIVSFIASGGKVKAIFVDYIQLLHKAGARNQRKDELRDICEDLKTLSKTMLVPSILACQLNRTAKTVAPNEISEQNIADASDIEHSANVVLNIWNNDQVPTGDKNLDLKHCDEIGVCLGEGGRIYCKLAKNRKATREIEAVLRFHGNSGKIDFENLMQSKLNNNAPNERKILIDDM